MAERRNSLSQKTISTSADIYDEMLEKCMKAPPEEVPSILAPVLQAIVVAAEACVKSPIEQGTIILTSKEEKKHAAREVKRTKFLEFVQRIQEQHHDNDVAMAMLGLKCMDEEEYSMAEGCFSAAIIANSECLMAVENLRVLYERMIHRWHFHMLNDLQRNSAYSKAITMAMQELSQDSAIIDIGSGTGLLR